MAKLTITDYLEVMTAARDKCQGDKRRESYTLRTPTELPDGDYTEQMRELYSLAAEWTDNDAAHNDGLVDHAVVDDSYLMVVFTEPPSSISVQEIELCTSHALEQYVRAVKTKNEAGEKVKRLREAKARINARLEHFSAFGAGTETDRILVEYLMETLGNADDDALLNVLGESA